MSCFQCLETRHESLMSSWCAVSNVFSSDRQLCFVLFFVSFCFVLFYFILFYLYIYFSESYLPVSHDLLLVIRISAYFFFNQPILNIFILSAPNTEKVKLDGIFDRLGNFMRRNCCNSLNESRFIFFIVPKNFIPFAKLSKPRCKVLSSWPWIHWDENNL